MKISKQIRNKRIVQINNLYNLIIANNEINKEELYKLLKEQIENSIDNASKEITNFIYEVLTKNLSITLSELKKIYSDSFNSDEVIKLQDIFYEEDGQSFEDRIENWFTNILSNNPSQKEILILFYHLCLILDTESFKIITYTMKNKLNTSYVEIIAGEGCEICNEHCDGEIHKEEDIELPPYHPSCQCEAIYYKKEDIVGDI